MLSTAILTTLLAALTNAAPAIKARQADDSSGPITLIATHSTAPIHLQPINAADNAFYIGRETVTYCPLEQYGACPAGNVTAIEVGGGRASMDVSVPGGQQIYIAPTGALSFTRAHSANINGGTTTGFVYTPNPDPEGNGLGHFTYSGGGWLACPVNATAAEESGDHGDGDNETVTPGQQGPWQIFAAVEGICDKDVPAGNVSDCIGMNALGAAFKAPGWQTTAAWQYE